MSADFRLPLRRRLANIAGQGLLTAIAALAVLLLVWLLGLMALKGSGAVFSSRLWNSSAGILASSQVVPLAVNLLLALAAAAALAGLAAVGLRRVQKRNPWMRVGEVRAPPAIAGVLAAAVLAACLQPGLALSPAQPVPWLSVLLLAFALAGPFAVAAGWTVAAEQAALLAAWSLGALAGFALLEASLDWDFLQSYSSWAPEDAGIKAGIVGTLLVGGVSMLCALPIGVMAAVYLSEFARPNHVTTLLRASIGNLAGVPSVVFGILGLAIFSRLLGYGNSILSAGLTLGLLTLPIVIVVCEEALRSVPNTVREAAFGLGARRWQVVYSHVLPYALPGMLTGAILALARSMGETAPLIVIGVAAYIDYMPEGPRDPFTALPYMAYEWAQMPGEAFQQLAWAAVLVLVALVLTGNLAAIILRDRAQKRTRW